MKAIPYKIKTVNPVIISSKRGDTNMVNTKSCIPGNTILGVLASLYIKDKKLKDAHRDKIFYSWFLGNELIFTNAYLLDETRKYFPLPHSIKEEKYTTNSAYDLIFKDENFNKSVKTGLPFITIEGKCLYGKSVKKSISFHHAGEKNSKNKIFNYDSLKKDQIFKGNIIGEQKELETFKKTFSDRFIAYIGLSKNSQYGKVEIELGKISDYEAEISTDVESDDTNVVMTLLSDTVIYNENGYSTTNTDDLEKLLGVKIKDSFIKKDEFEQFVGVWRLKNQSETVFTAGSCFKIDKLPDDYEDLQIKGVGEKTNEGFGRVVFGWQNKNFQYINKKEVKTTDKPDGSPPQIVKKIVEGIIKERLRNKAISKAMNDAYQFKNPPGKSLCGKLQSIANNMDDFRNDFNQIAKNKIAEDQLKKCNNERVKLLEYLKTAEFVDINSLLNGINNLDEFIEPLQNDQEFKKSLEKTYLRTFFNFMRKNERRKK